MLIWVYRSRNNSRSCPSRFSQREPLPDVVRYFGSLFADPDFAALFPDNGQPGLSPVRLMLILILQFKIAI
jgi:hypothetical protein